MSKFYSVVTFGKPHHSARRVRQCRSLARAIRSAAECKGSGECTDARVYECSTRELARTADIALLRPGEQIVYVA